MQLRGQGNNVDQSLADAATRPKLPVYKDGDDAVSYIARFKPGSSLLKLDLVSFAVRIGNLLSGRVLSQQI